MLDTNGKLLVNGISDEWVVDSVYVSDPSNGIRIPPPHLSPFVDNEEEGAYVPDYAKTIKRLQDAARKEVLPLPGVGKEDLGDPQNLLVEGIIDRAEANEAAQRKEKMKILEQQYHDELKKELQGAAYTPMVSNVDEQTSVGEIKSEEESTSNIKQNVEDSANMPLVMMSRRKRKLLEAVQISNERKRAANDLIKQRKKKLEESQR